jgi:CPA2 family monovalent cation:H+ antiporter-2
LLWWVARTGSQELFTLSVVAIAIGVAFGAASLFDVSFALGAFFAGMMMRESQYSHRAADESLPLRDAFAVLFFVSVGMLFDPAVIWDQPFRLLGVLLIILLGKTVAAVLLVLFFRYSLQTALTVGVSLAQIGEFSFILASLGVALGLMPAEGQSLVVAAAILSIALNTFMFSLIEPVHQAMLKHFAWARRMESRFDPLAEVPMSTDLALLSNQVVLVGYGRVGRTIAASLRAQSIACVVVDQNRERIDKLRAAGSVAVCGDAVEPDVLVQAHVARAAMLIVALPDALDVRKIVHTAKTLNPSIAVILRSQSAGEAALLRQEQIGDVFLAENELAKGMTEHALKLLSKDSKPADN